MSDVSIKTAAALRCPRCRSRLWLGLDAGGEFARCVACGHHCDAPRPSTPSSPTVLTSARLHVARYDGPVEALHEIVITVEVRSIGGELVYITSCPWCDRSMRPKYRAWPDARRFEVDVSCRDHCLTLVVDRGQFWWR